MEPFVTSLRAQIHSQLKKIKSPNASCIPKVLLIFGRIKERRSDFRLV